MDPEDVIEVDVVDDIAKMKFVPNEEFDEESQKISQKIEEQLK